MSFIMYNRIWLDEYTKSFLEAYCGTVSSEGQFRNALRFSKSRRYVVKQLLLICMRKQ